MFPGTIRGHNFTYNAPAGVDNCQDLRVRVDHYRINANTPVRVINSAWFPTPEELAALNAGEPVVLSIYGSDHPVVSMSVQTPESISAG